MEKEEFVRSFEKHSVYEVCMSSSSGSDERYRGLASHQLQIIENKHIVSLNRLSELGSKFQSEY